MADTGTDAFDRLAAELSRRDRPIGPASLDAPATVRLPMPGLYAVKVSPAGITKSVPLDPDTVLRGFDVLTLRGLALAVAVAYTAWQLVERGSGDAARDRVEVEHFKRAIGTANELATEALRVHGGEEEDDPTVTAG
jgi:hypothetical protein